MAEEERMWIRKLYRRFETLDALQKSGVRRVATFFMRNEVAAFFRQIFEPAASGMAMGAALLLFDQFRSHYGAPELFKHAIESAVEHAKPYPFFLTLLFLSAYLLTAGSLLSTIARRFIVLPLARLSTHATMFALGIFWVLSLLEIWSTGQGSVMWKTIVVTLALVGLGGCSNALASLFESAILDRLGARYQSMRLICLGLGGIFLTISLLGLKELSHEDSLATKAKALGPMSASAPGH